MAGRYFQRSNQMAAPIFKGILNVVTTPFTDTGRIDFNILGRHIEFLLANGVHAIVSGGTTGEYYAQTTKERRELLEFVARVVAGRVPTYAGVGSARPEETIELGRVASDLGYEAQMLSAPCSSLPDTEELVAYVRRVAAEVPLPIILYNYPARTGVDMSPEFLLGVSDIPSICAIKESSGSFARMIEQAVKLPGLQRICGADRQAVDAFLWGSTASITGAANFLPSEHVALYEACVLRQDFPEGMRLMRTMLPLLCLLEESGKYVQYVKYGTELAGLAVGPARAPLGRLTESEKRNFRQLYEAAKAAR